MGAITKKEQKVVFGPETAQQLKTGYIPILRGDDFGSRTLDEDNTPSLFETEDECKDAFTVGEDRCVAIAKVTWREAA